MMHDKKVERILLLLNLINPVNSCKFVVADFFLETELIIVCGSPHNLVETTSNPLHPFMVLIVNNLMPNY